MKIALTDMGVRRLAPGTYFDLTTPAFGIRIGEHRRTWIVTKGQRPRRTVTLGHYPLVSLQEARKLAFAAFIEAEHRGRVISFPDAREEFLKLDRWRAQTRRVLASNLKHFKWTKRLHKITNADVMLALDDIVGPSARWHARKDITTFFNWCIPRYLAASPVQGIRAEKQHSRARVLSDDELRAVWHASVELEHPFGHLVRLLILKGQRCGEMSNVHSTFVEKDRLYLPPSITKNGREHWVPLTPYDRALLPDRTGLLFPNSKGKPFSAFAFNHARLLLASGTHDWTLHDLRRTFATGHARIGTPIHVLEKMLNHVSGSLHGVAGIYNRYDYWDEQVAATAAWEARVLEMCG